MIRRRHEPQDFNGSVLMGLQTKAFGSCQSREVEPIIE